MKILIALLFPLALFAQKKGDNTIIISHDVPMSKIKAVLFKSGYAITTSDTAFISTSPKEAANTIVSMIVMIARIDTVTYLKAQIKSAVSANLFGVMPENNYSLLSFNPKKASEEGRAWLELDRIAKELSPALIYVKQ